jgi:hypothetical protein
MRFPLISEKRLPVAALFLVATVVGCSPSGQSAVDIPHVDPAAAAEKAIELYDRSGDGSLDQAELAACPGILTGRNRYDTDGDQKISREEIAARIGAIFAGGVGLTPVSCRVFAGGQPLAGAVVRFVPEEFLGDALKPAVGTTDADGLALIAIPDDQLPADQAGLQSMQPGVYRVEIKQAGIAESAKPLGCEIDPTARGGTELLFRL